MGVYAPTPFVTAEMMRLIEETILKPTFDGLKAEGLLLHALVPPFGQKGNAWF